ncbi:uncharacterized protein [Amphiura filiformis]|uniref:uncharacterized protein isoform X1 n=1 Tax=Amphiura filiformis TaxID=82378 RepID=UPI003B227FA2
MCLIVIGLKLILLGVASVIVAILRIYNNVQEGDVTYRSTIAIIVAYYSTGLWAGLSYILSGSLCIASSVERRNRQRMNKMVGFAVSCSVSIIGASLTVKEEGIYLHLSDLYRDCFVYSHHLNYYECKDYYLAIAATVIGSVAFLLSVFCSMIAYQNTCSGNEAFNEENFDRRYFHDQRRPPYTRMEDSRYSEDRDLHQPPPYSCNQLNQSYQEDEDNVQNQQPPPYSYNMPCQVYF